MNDRPDLENILALPEFRPIVASRSISTTSASASRVARFEVETGYLRPTRNGNTVDGRIYLRLDDLAEWPESESRSEIARKHGC